jgi:C1A family cysteine protease
MHQVLKILLVFGFLSCAAASGEETRAEETRAFEAFVQKYNKTYASASVHAQRFDAFQRTIKRVALRNARSLGAVFGITQFSDLTPDEFRDIVLSTKEEGDQSLRSRVDVAPAWTMEGKIPAAFDWRNRPGIVAGVRDQRQCGSCWAFSAVENVASVWELQGPGPALYPLLPSVQQVVDCDSLAKGCNGGNPNLAFDYIKKADGLESEISYPYMGEKEMCQVRPLIPKKPTVVHISGHEVPTKSKNETAMQAYCAKTAPLSVSVVATIWQDYRGGVLTASDQCACAKCHVDHAVLIDGFNTTTIDNGTTLDYWIVRNSWVSASSTSLL